MSAPAWAVGMQKIGPGMYCKGAEWHIDPVEICRHLGACPTEANLKIVEQEARAVLKEMFGVDLIAAASLIKDVSSEGVN